MQGLMPHARILLPFASLAVDGKPPQGPAIKQAEASHDQDLQELFNEIDTNNEGYVNAHKLQVSIVRLCKNIACMITCCLNILAWGSEEDKHSELPADCSVQARAAVWPRLCGAADAAV